MSFHPQARPRQLGLALGDQLNQDLAEFDGFAPGVCPARPRAKATADGVFLPRDAAQVRESCRRERAATWKTEDIGK